MRKTPLEDRILEYLRTVGYKGMGVMSKDLQVRFENVKWTLNKMVFERKVEPVIYGGIRLYKAKRSRVPEKRPAFHSTPTHKHLRTKEVVTHDLPKKRLNGCVRREPSGSEKART